MLSLTSATRIFLYRGSTDMRRSFDGLCGMVRQEMGADPLSGSLFVFCNRRRTMVKILYWVDDGFVVWAKRLERGTFRMPVGADGHAEIDRRGLTMLLEGVAPRRLHRRYQRSA